MERELNLEETHRLAQRIAAQLRGGELLALCGDLGAGKTTFTRELTRALGCRRLANSPTFSLVQTYKGGRLPVLHCDFYRLASAEELEELGWQEMLEEYEQGVIVVEWADKFPECLPDQRLTLHWSYGSDDEHRRVRLETSGESLHRLREALS